MVVLGVAIVAMTIVVVVILAVAVLGLAMLAVAIFGLTILTAAILVGWAAAAFRVRRSAVPMLAVPLLVAAVAVSAALVATRRAVADRYAIVIGMDLAEGEEAVPVAAEIDERRLKRRLYPRDLREIDVSFDLLLCRGTAWLARMTSRSAFLSGAKPRRFRVLRRKA